MGDYYLVSDLWCVWIKFIEFDIVECQLVFYFG